MILLINNDNRFWWNRPVLDTLNLSGNNHEGDTIFNLTGSLTGKTLNLDFNANFAGHKIKILATVVKISCRSKTKTLNNDSTVNISSQSTIENGVIGLGKADVFKLENVYMSSGLKLLLQVLQIQILQIDLI